MQGYAYSCYFSDYFQRVKVQLSCSILQVLYKDSRVIIELRDTCSYFYCGFRYEIIVYFRFESYMGGFMEALVAEYRQYVGIRT